jgi:hypothetical protein
MGFPWDSYRLFIHRKIVDPLIVVDPREALPNLRHLDLRGVGISAEGLSELRCRGSRRSKNGSTWGKFKGDLTIQNMEIIYEIMGFTQVCSPKFWNKGWDLSTKAWK